MMSIPCMSQAVGDLDLTQGMSACLHMTPIKHTTNVVVYYQRSCNPAIESPVALQVRLDPHNTPAIAGKMTTSNTKYDNLHQHLVCLSRALMSSLVIIPKESHVGRHIAKAQCMENVGLTCGWQ